MKIAVQFLLLALVATACAQSYTGQQFTFGADIAAHVRGDIASVTGYTRVRTVDGNQLFFESALNNAVNITSVQIRLSPGDGASAGGPLVLALTDTTLSPLSASDGQPLVQSGSKTNADLLGGNPQLASARQALLKMGIRDNALQNIGDVDRLLRQGVLYSDVHTNIATFGRVGSGLFSQLPPSLGKRLS